ncbi:MAG: hypothetical protein IJM17_00555 [Firmicutes bacterium]|nr:hypothetical protein [Bacillota bacterium]
MKRVLITGGPTNEYIDEVMKITNMSTGSLSLSLADRALKKGDEVTLVLTNSVLKSALFADYGFKEWVPGLKVIPIETTQDMYEALESEALHSAPYDVIIHAAAVGDYKPQFSFRMEDMAAELAEEIMDAEALDKEELYELILSTMTDPQCKVNDDSKISSYEPHLTVKLTLTVKIIASLRKWFPNALLIGCKLLENVPREHLIDVAHKLCVKNDMDYIMANDLAQLRAGEPVRYLVNRDGFTGQVLNGEEGPALLDYASDNWF